MFEPTTNTLRNTKIQFSSPFTQNKNLHCLVLFQQDKLIKQFVGHCSTPAIHRYTSTAQQALGCCAGWQRHIKSHE